MQLALKDKIPTYNLLVGSDKSKSVNCKSVKYAKTVQESKKKPMLAYILPHRTFVFLAEGLCNTPPSIWWSEAEANPAQVTFHHWCLHWPGFTRKQKKVRTVQASVLESMMFCSCPQSIREDLYSRYSIPKDKTSSLMCQKRTDW